MTDLIIGAVIGVFVGIYVSNPKARKWVADKVFKSKRAKLEEKKKDKWNW